MTLASVSTGATVRARSRVNNAHRQVLPPLRRGVLLPALDAEPSVAEPSELDLQFVRFQAVGLRGGRVQQVVDTWVFRGVGAEANPREAGLLAQVVDGDERSAVPVAAVGQDARQPG